MPDWLDEVARQYWRRVVPELVAMGVAKAIDAEALTGMCRWYAIWRQADARLQPCNGNSYSSYKLIIEAATAWKMTHCLSC
jgi:P27 family predicted phage terminase small subunit